MEPYRDRRGSLLMVAESTDEAPNKYFTLIFSTLNVTAGTKENGIEIRD